MKVALLTAKANNDALVDGHKFATDEKRTPTGIGYLYSVLRKNGIIPEVYDRYCNGDLWEQRNFKEYDFVGIYCASVCIDDVFSIIDKIEAKIIAVGGPHAFLYPESFSKKVTHIVRGEAENIISPLVSGEFSERIITTDRLDNDQLNSLPRYPYEIFINKNIYTWTSPFGGASPVVVVNSSRGCPFNCSFCSVKKIWGRRYTYFSSDRVLDDLLYVKSLGGRSIYFREDNFTCKTDRIVEICEGMLNANINMEWMCESRVDTVDMETMKLMKRAGCIGFYVGVEHLSQKMLDVFNKGVTVDQILTFFDRANSLGIKTAASLIKGHPEESSEDLTIQRTLLPRLRPTMMWFNQFRSEG